MVQRRNNLLPYYQNEIALRELIQLYSFAILKIVQKTSEINDQQKNLNLNHWSFVHQIIH